MAKFKWNDNAELNKQMQDYILSPSEFMEGAAGDWGYGYKYPYNLTPEESNQLFGGEQGKRQAQLVGAILKKNPDLASWLDYERAQIYWTNKGYDRLANLTWSGVTGEMIQRDTVTGADGGFKDFSTLPQFNVIGNVTPDDAADAIINLVNTDPEINKAFKDAKAGRVWEVALHNRYRHPE